MAPRIPLSGSRTGSERPAIPLQAYVNDDAKRGTISALTSAIREGVPNRVVAAYDAAVAAGCAHPLDYMVGDTNQPEAPQVMLREVARALAGAHQELTTASLNPAEFPDHLASFEELLKRDRGVGLAGRPSARTGDTPIGR